MSKLVIRGEARIKGTLASGAGDNILTRDATTKDVTEISGSITSLQENYIFVGNSSSVPTGVPMSGDISIVSSGVTSINAGVIVDADINTAAAITLSKLAALTVDRAVVSNGSGFLTTSPATTTEVGYLSGVTSAIQTQLNAKQATITGAATTITSVNLVANRALIANASGKVAVSATTDTELSYVSGVISPIQAQLDAKLTVSLTSSAEGDILYRNGSGVYINLPIGINGTVLTVSGGVPVWTTGTSNGLPVGGTTNQYLRKNSNTNYDVVWDTLTLSKITDVTSSSADLNLLQGLSATLTNTEISYLDGVTSSIQTQLNNKLTRTLSYNSLFLGNGSNLAAELAAGTNGDVLTVVGGTPTWQTPTPPGNVSGPVSSTDNAIVRWNGTSGNSIQDSGILLDDTNNVVFPTGTGVRTSTSIGNTLLLQAYDVDGAAYTTFGTLTAGNTPTFNLSSSTTVGGNLIYTVGGTDVSLADGGTGASLTDPNADRILFWDDSAGQVTWLEVGTNLTITGTVISATGGAGGYSSVEQDGTPLTARTTINVSNGLTAADDAGNTETTLKLGGTLTANTAISGSGSFFELDLLNLGNMSVGIEGGNFQVGTSDGDSVSVGGGSITSNTGSHGITVTDSYSLSFGSRLFQVSSSGWELDLTSDSTGDVYYRNSGGFFTRLPIGTTSHVLQVSSGIPSWGQVVTAGIGDNQVTDLKLRDSSANSVIGRATNSTGDPTDISASVDGDVLRLSGTTLGFGTLSTASIGNSQITYAKIQDATALSVLGRASNTSGVLADIVAGSDFHVLRRSGTTVGFGTIGDASISSLAWSKITGTPTTLAGYGITDAYTQAQSDANYWKVTGTTTLTGNTTISSGSNTITYNYTSAVGTTVPYTFAPSITATANSQVMVAHDLNTTFSNGGFTNTINVGLRVRTGRVSFGLSTSTPDGALHVKGTGTTSGSSTLALQRGDNAYILRALDDGLLRIGNAGSPPNIGAGDYTSGTSLLSGSAFFVNALGGFIIQNSSDGQGIRFVGTVAPGSGTNIRSIYTTSTYNFTTGTNATYAYDYNPSFTGTTGLTKYGVVIRPTDSFSGFGLGATQPSATLHVSGTVKFDLTSDTTGDVFYRNSGGNFTRLGIGSSGQVLTVSGGLPSWQNAAGGISGLTTGRVPYAASATTLTDEAGFEYDATNNRLTVDTFRVGSTSIAGGKIIDTESSDADANLTIKAKALGRIYLQAQFFHLGEDSNGNSVRSLDANGSSTDITLQLSSKNAAPVELVSNAITLKVDGYTDSNTIGLRWADSSSAGVAGMTGKLIAGSNTAGSGDGSGGDIYLQTGQRRTAGVGVDGDLVIDTRQGTTNFLNGSTTPSAESNMVKVYSKDVSASAELFVMDESGFETQLS